MSCYVVVELDMAPCRHCFNSQCLREGTATGILANFAIDNDTFQFSMPPRRHCYMLKCSSMERSIGAFQFSMPPRRHCYRLNDASQCRLTVGFNSQCLREGTATLDENHRYRPACQFSILNASEKALLPMHAHGVLLRKSSFNSQCLREGTATR